MVLKSSSPEPEDFPMPANCCRVVPFTWLDARPVVAVAYTPAVSNSLRQRMIRFRTRDFPVPAHPDIYIYI